jgi:large repetitive protein
VTVTKATTAVAVTPSPASIASGGTVTLTAKVTTTSNGAGPTGTVQFKNGSTALGSPVTCTPTAAGASAAFCTATLSTKLSQFVPTPMGRPGLQVPVRMMWIMAYLLLLAFVLGLRLLPAAKRRPYAYAGLLLFAMAAAGIAGCAGTSSGTSGNTRAITATYSGDANYAASSGAASVTVQ